MLRVDDPSVISGIVLVIRSGLRWHDLAASYGPNKTIYNLLIRWNALSVFGLISRELAKGGGGSAEMIINATHLTAHRIAASLFKNGLSPVYLPHQRWPELAAARDLRQ